jgi:hypothetical protein
MERDGTLPSERMHVMENDPAHRQNRPRPRSSHAATSPGGARSAKGGLTNQKYEIIKHIQRHLHVVHNTPASAETTNWKEGVPAKPVGNHFVRGRLEVEEMNHRNEALSNRLFEIMHEQREARSYEYAPGWRAGLGKLATVAQGSPAWVGPIVPLLNSCCTICSM